VRSGHAESCVRVTSMQGLHRRLHTYSAQLPTCMGISQQLLIQRHATLASLLKRPVPSVLIAWSASAPSSCRLPRTASPSPCHRLKNRTTQLSPRSTSKAGHSSDRRLPSPRPGRRHHAHRHTVDQHRAQRRHRQPTTTCGSAATIGNGRSMRLPGSIWKAAPHAACYRATTSMRRRRHVCGRFPLPTA